MSPYTGVSLREADRWKCARLNNGMVGSTWLGWFLVSERTTMLPWNARGLVVLGWETCTGVSISLVLSWLPDYAGRRSNPVNASLFRQIKQFQQDGAKKKKKKKPVMSRNRSRTWASCSEMSICMHIFQMKEEVLLSTIKKPSPRYSDDGFVSAFRLFREVFSSAL